MGNNPVNFNDPTGHKACDEEKGCGGTLPKINRTPPPGGGGEGSGKNEDDRNDDPRRNVSEDSNKDKPCSGDDNTLKCTGKRILSGPDYISLNVPIPVLYGLVGFDILITRDYYNNWYIGGGGAGTTGPGFDFGFGWFLTDERSESALEKKLSGHSFTVSGGSLIGIGGNNIDPTFIHPEMNHSTKAKDFAIEPEITTPGGSAVYTYSIPFYDNGNPDPWFPSIPRFWK